MEERPPLRFAGVPVRFPYVPYRAQNALMHAVVSAATKQQHALLESPTGTGKSLALLCASLAWQEHVRGLIAGGGGACEDARGESDGAAAGGCGPVAVRVAPPPASRRAGAEENEKERRAEVPVSESRNVEMSPLVQVQNGRGEAGKPRCQMLDDDSDFEEPKQFRDVSWQRRLGKRKPVVVEEPENAHMFEHLLAFERDAPLDSFSDAEAVSDDEDAQTLPRKVPRIFYATRTHNQVAQVVAELRKTQYRPRMVVLASRGEYCLREEVRRGPSRDEVCKGLVKVGDCQYFFEAKSLAEEEELADEAWDIEELRELGEKHGGCPYYASHELYQNAELVLCPYSFLVDPIVRTSRGINLKGDIVILDEAHNIENVARESASFQGDVGDLRRSTEEVDTMMLTGRLGGTRSDLSLAYGQIKQLIECLLTLVDNATEAFVQHADHENVLYERDDLLEKMKEAGITAEKLPDWRQARELIVAFKEKEADADTLDEGIQESGGRVGPAGFGYAPGSSSEPAAKQNLDEGSNESARARRGQFGGRRGRALRRRSRGRGSVSGPGGRPPAVAPCVLIANQFLTTLEFFFKSTDDFALVVDRRIAEYVTVVTVKLSCLNAALSFREISERARSVIVTSGTLAPLKSFAGELGTGFAVCKSLPHVVNVQKQLYVGVVAEGPEKVVFDATFSGSARFSFQDAVGNAIVDYCKIIPGGVLVFFPSYRMLEQLRSRWCMSDIWARLQTVKGSVLVEPNKRGDDFDATMAEYGMASTSDSGAVMFGVFRGKLSEGVDFKDSAARGVVVVGIPFPYKGDVLIARKRAWNDRERREAGRKELLPGSFWYEIQAFRALNQALGRALRHRYDYGAILLVDNRFRQDSVLDQLPKWTRDGLRRTDGSHLSALTGLSKFFCNVQGAVASIAGAHNYPVQRL